MDRIHWGGPIVATFAVLLALAVFVGPAAGAAGTVATDSQVAEESTTHQFSVDAAQAGTLESVDLEYDSDVDLGGAAVTVGVDTDGDGDIDERVPADVVRGDRGVGATVGQQSNVTAGDAVVVVVRGVENPSTVGAHTATVETTVDGATDGAAVTYRVTPFRSDDTEFRSVAVPGSSFDRAYAADSTVADARLTAADWEGVTLSGAVLEDVRATDDEWSRVEFADTTATTVRTERTAFDGVRFSRASVSTLRSTGDRWETVSVTDTRLGEVDSRATTYRDVRLSDARVTEFSAESSTLANVSVGPSATNETARENRSSTQVGANNGTAEAAFGLNGPAPSDDAIDAVMARFVGAEHAPDGTVSNVTLREATLQNVSIEDGALVDVRVESATLRNVTLENVTLRGVTLSGATYADGTLSDEVITSEEELRQELLVDEAAAAVSDGDVDASASATPTEGNATADDGGFVDNADDSGDDATDDLLGN